MKFGGEEEQHKGDAELPAKRGTACMHHALFAQGDIIFRNSGRGEVRGPIIGKMIWLSGVMSAEVSSPC